MDSLVDTAISLSQSLAGGDAGTGCLKLVGEHFSHTIQPTRYPNSLSVKLGRKTPAMSGDILAIAADKNISREHCHIHWDYDLGRWRLDVKGKNGLHVEDRFVPCDVSVALSWEGKDWIKIQIGDVILFALRPKSGGGQSQRVAQLPHEY